MFRKMKNIFTTVLVFAIMAAFGYFVVLPGVLPLKYQDLAEKYAAQNTLELSLVNAVIFSESHFNPSVVSSAGAVGLMQVTEETGSWAAEQMGMDADEIDLTDPETNIRIGCWYLHWLLEKFDGVTETALAGYNAGHGNVARWLADEEMSRDGITLEEIPYAETEGYVRKVRLAKAAYQLFYRQ